MAAPVAPWTPSASSPTPTPSSSFESAPVASPTPSIVTTTITTPIIEITNVEDTTTATVTSVLTLYFPAPTEISPTSSKTIWFAPAQMTDLSAFNVSSFGGKQNLQLVDGIPADASATSFAAEAAPSDAVSSWNNDSSVLQLLYPASSINPGNKDRPQGGAQFYATPVDITNASNVTMNFSVFFPVDFDFVKGGKLPGIYGGHKGCSGGAAADDCFSTRLMWRTDGEGELYLYAPKDKQTAALCDAPDSVCDAAYGFSIGRGSFSYNRGAWTTLTQTIALNTPGKQNGFFALDVNGARVIQRDDVYYRNPTKPEETTPSAIPEPTQSHGGLLGGILGGILANRDAQWSVVLNAPRPGMSISEEEEEDQTQVGFLGMFFSTFFGGHEDYWATPKDQYTWFKDFALSVNG